LALLASPLQAADFTGKVVGITDGDTITVMLNGRGTTIRLNAIDCPEKRQAFGNRAKQAASELAFGQGVTVQTFGLDKYGRTIGDVTLPDGKSLNRELVRAGLCWWYRKYAPNDCELEKLEVEAPSEKRGLWAEPSPVPPWAFRKLRRGETPDLSDVMPMPAPLLGVSERGPPDKDLQTDIPLPVLGNRKSLIYHRPDCPNYGEIAPRNRVPFKTAAEAVAAGYRLAKNCP
jgi:micrococcal nuclease